MTKSLTWKNWKYTDNPLWNYAPQPLLYLPSVLYISLTLFKSIFINVFHNHNLFDKIFWDDLKFVVSITFPVNAFVVFHLSNRRHKHTYTYISRLLNTTYKWLYVCLCMDLWCITFEGVTKSPLRDHPWDVEAASKLPTLIVYAYYFQWGKDMK